MSIEEVGCGQLNATGIGSSSCKGLTIRYARVFITRPTESKTYIYGYKLLWERVAAAVELS